MFRLLFSFVLGFSLFTTLSATASVWTDVNEWSPAYENRFAEWVRQEWRTDFFSRRYLPNGQRNPYYGLSLDCADTVYSMRIIFSYENHLPFVIQDPTASGKTISNKMHRWDFRTETNRVRNFLEFIYGTVSTLSLPNDTYPVAVSRDTIHAGGLIMTTHKNHHSWTVKQILPIGVPHLIFNSVLGSKWSLTLKERQSWPNPEWVFEGAYNPAGDAGFRYWRPERYINKPVWEVPGYSEEQYHIPIKNWVPYVQSRLAIRKETDEQTLKRLITSSCEGLTERVPSVKEGLDYLKGHPRCMDYTAYDSYSTPSRDHRLFDDLMSLRRAYRQIIIENGGNSLPLDLIQKMNKIFPSINSSAAVENNQMPAQTINALSVCLTEYLPGKKMDLAEFKRRMFLGWVSNNPNESGQYRWGDLEGPSQHARQCSSWDNWTPDISRD
ncbi:MAG: hypothetical protein ACXVCL_14830 [Bdellovibrio sp.]